MLLQRETQVFFVGRSTFHRFLLPLVFGWFACLVVLALLPLQTEAATYGVQGKPTVTVKFINSVLAAYHSPAVGKGQALYNDGVKYGIDPVYALGFFFQESRFGTTGVARVTLSLGNIRTPVTPDCRCRAYQGYRQYTTWEDGFLDWYKLIAKLYVIQWKLKIVDSIIPVYAPSSDHNNVAAYIATVKHTVDTWRIGRIVV